jgi:aminomethyltransferase
MNEQPTSGPQIQYLALHQEHEKLHCKFSPFAGFMMPLQYSSIKEEVQAVREHVGLFDVSHMGEFFVFGPEAVHFLDHLVTNDVSQLPVKKALYTSICKEGGGVIDDLIIYRLQESEFLICVNASNIEKDWSHFLEHKKSFRCELSNISDRCSLLALQGPKAKKLLHVLGYSIEHVPTYGIGDLPKKPFHTILKNNDPFLIISRTGYTGEDGFELFGDHATISTLWKTLIQKGHDDHLRPCGLAARDVLRIEAGYPLYGHELDDNHTPFEGGIGWTVKMKKKSPFIGLSTFQKMSPRWALKRFSVEKVIPRSEYKILNEEGLEVGYVTSGTFSPTISKGIGMARIQSTLPNSPLFMEVRGQKHLIQLHQQFLPKKESSL